MKIWKPTTKSSKESHQFPSYPRGLGGKKRHSAYMRLPSLQKEVAILPSSFSAEPKAELHGTAAFLHVALPIFQHLQQCWVWASVCIGLPGGMCSWGHVHTKRSGDEQQWHLMVRSSSCEPLVILIFGWTAPLAQNNNNYMARFDGLLAEPAIATPSLCTPKKKHQIIPDLKVENLGQIPQSGQRWNLAET